MQIVYIRELLKTILIDLLDDNLFTLSGIARELNIPEEVIENIYTQENHEPSCSLVFGLLHLHFEHFPGLYPRLNELNPAKALPEESIHECECKTKKRVQVREK